MTRTQWLSLLLSPVGALTRYELGERLNDLRGDFVVGTFAANLFACLLDGVAYGIRDSKDHEEQSEAEAGVVMLCSAVGVGVGGCCSTVSTFMTDTIALMDAPSSSSSSRSKKSDPPYAALRYVLVTMAACCTLPLLTYLAVKLNYSS